MVLPADAGMSPGRPTGPGEVCVLPADAGVGPAGEELDHQAGSSSASNTSRGHAQVVP